MTLDMQNAIDKIFSNDYLGATRKMFLRSQITELLSHFFEMLTNNKSTNIKSEYKEKLYIAKKILTENIVTPPTLNELSKTIGTNRSKLNKNFKELFGVPVFKYLQIERLNKAHQLLREGKMSIQQVAFFVGYDSLSSFSNAFLKKFGMRPSQIKI